MGLRAYQQEILDRVQKALKPVKENNVVVMDGKRSVLLQAPTGAGKTRMFVHMCKGLLKRGKRVYILVHRAELLKQACKALEDQGVPYGVIWKNHPMTPDLIQVCSVNTLVKRLDRLPKPDFLIIDECHHAPAGMWLQVAEWLPKSSKIVGVTATPERLDGKGLTMFEEMVVGPPVRQLMDEGWLCDYVLYQPDLGVDLSKLHTRFGDYITKELNELLNTPKIIGDCVQHYKSYCPNNEPAVAFCVNLEHAENVAMRFRQEGIPAMSIDGKLSESEREARLNALASGEIAVLTSCNLINEGFDLPRVTVAILMRPTQSLAMYLQQVGRVLRPDANKEHAIIIDHVGNSIRHFLPDDEREWSLLGTREERGDKMEAEERAKRLRRCPECYAQFRPADQCPRCGYVFKDEPLHIKEVAGELVLAKKTAKQLQEEENQRKITEMSPEHQQRLKDARSYADFSALAAELGLPDTWAKEQTRKKNAFSLDLLRKAAYDMGYQPGWAEKIYFSSKGGGGRRGA